VKLLSNKKLKDLIFEEYGKLLFEQGEDDEGTGKDGGETGGNTEKTSGEKEPEEKPDEEPEEEPEEKIDLEPDDMFAVGKEIDTALEKVLLGFETRALKSAELEKQSLGVHESYRLVDILKEEKEPAIDVGQFVDDVARLINNYQYLLDMEAIIYNKAQDYLLDKYGAEAGADFVDKMRDMHSIDFSKPELDREQHFAVTGAPGGSDVGFGTGGGGE
jgi:hypothetical protein